MSRSRLDKELVARGLVSTRSRARQAIRDGLVAVDGSTASRPGVGVAAGTSIEVSAVVNRFVGRGALKLETALEHFPIEVAGRSAIDVGASTGGFTDVLLQRGVRKVAAVDAGHDQLHQQLRDDPRVDVHEGVNVRSVDVAALGGPFDVVVADLSFISLCILAGNIADLGLDTSDWVVLVKPQFEVGRSEIGKGGVVRSAQARAQAVENVAAAFTAVGLFVLGAVDSHVPGGSGNREALLWLRRNGESVSRDELIKVLADE